MCFPFYTNTISQLYHFTIMHIVIIGNGISGITTARWVRKLSDHQVTVISDETDYFFSRTALMYIYMGHMRFQDTQPYENWFWEKNRIKLLRDRVQSIDIQDKTLNMRDSSDIKYDKLVLALGSEPNKFGWPGQDLDGVQGMYSAQDLEGMEKHSAGLKHAVIVGGGLIGIEMAEMFHSRHIPVTFLVREKSYWSMVLAPEESAMVNRVIHKNGIDLRLSTELKEILPDENGKCRAVMTNKGEEIPCQFVGLTAGVHPNITFIKDTEIETQKGIVVNENLETSVKDIYAVGDCAQLRNPPPGRRPIEAVWYVGRMMGETAAYNICGKPIAYKPGIWFNSAKFFDIEYQVYGTVLANPPADHQSLYWEHPEGEKSIRIVWDDMSGMVIGFQTMGIRYRDEVCRQWIRDKAHIENVLMNLGLANFDPEFYDQYEADIVAMYNQKTRSNLQLAEKRGLNSVVKFIKKQFA